MINHLLPFKTLLKLFWNFLSLFLALIDVKGISKNKCLSFLER